MKDLLIPLIIIAAIIMIGLTGGVKNMSLNPNPATSSSVTQTTNQSNIPSPTERQLSQTEIANQIQNTQYQTESLKQQIAAEQDKKNSSQYKNQITMNWGWSTLNPDQEYVEIDANSSNTSSVNISGWQITSTSTGQTITIPQSTGLYTANGSNSLENVLLAPGEKAYVVTGRSPIYYGFHANICSGYLSQFNTFTPGLYTYCPIAQNEKSIITIPRTQSNINCFDFVNSVGSCQTPNPSTLNNTYSSQCQDFVATKLNYQGCVNEHRNDANFNSPHIWYVYLKHDISLWQPRYETIILSDTLSKKVYTLSR
jgi:hypothetical protein